MQSKQLEYTQNAGLRRQVENSKSQQYRWQKGTAKLIAMLGWDRLRQTMHNIQMLKSWAFAL